MKKKTYDHLGNEYESIDAMCKAYGITFGQFKSRKRCGKTLEECLTMKSKEQQEADKAVERTGERFLQRNGYTATITAYRGSTDCDVVFDDEDGSIREHVTYFSVKNGEVSLTKTRENYYDKCLYQSKMMKCGLVGTVTEIRNYYDITVRFENNIETKSTISKFNQGMVELSQLEITKAKRLHESKQMGNGHTATIIRYDGCDDMDVEFENGVKRCHVTYEAFKDGRIALYKDKAETYKQSRIGEIGTAKNGEPIEIIAYRGTQDMDIRFPDGTIREHMNYRYFLNGSIAKNGYDERRQNRLGHSKMMKCGLIGTIVENLDNGHVLVEFEDGIQKEFEYKNFKTGNCAHPELSSRNPNKNFHGFYVVGRGQMIGDDVYYTVKDKDNKERFLTPRMMLQLIKEKEEINTTDSIANENSDLEEYDLE